MYTYLKIVLVGKADDGSLGEEEPDNLGPSTVVTLRWTPSIMHTMLCDENADADKEGCDHACRAFDNGIYGECRNGRCDCCGHSTQECAVGYMGLWTVSSTL